MKTSKALVKKQLTLVALVLALALAVYLNWSFARTDKDNKLVTEVLAGQSGEQTQPAAGAADAQTSADADKETQDGAQQGDTYYGEALFVSADTEYAEGYFAEARLTRSKTRDEALETLEKALAKTDLTETEKANLTAKLTATSGAIEKEGAAESQIKAKGFADCVVFLSGGKVRAVVKSGPEGLTAPEVAQIKEILLETCGVDVTDINIVEIK